MTTTYRVLWAVRRSARLAWRELPLLVLLAAFSASCWIFVEISDEVLEGEAASLDETILLGLRSAGDLKDPIGPVWVEEMFGDLTSLGSVSVLTLISLAVICYTTIRRRWRTAVFLLMALGSGFLLSFAMKAGFDRPRPDLVPHAANVRTASFPSAHSMMSALVYLTLGAMLARIHESRRLKAYLLGLAALVTLLVGTSRIYLGVHWPTDVLAGWAAGAAWAFLWWIIAYWLARRDAG